MSKSTRRRLPDWMHYCDCGKAISKTARACKKCISAERAAEPESLRDYRKRVIDPERNA